MALLDIRHYIRPQCIPLQRFPPPVDTALRYISGNLVRNDPPSSTIALCWHLPNGSRDNHQYDCLRLRPRLGDLGYLPGKRKIVMLTCKSKF